MKRVIISLALLVSMISAQSYTTEEAIAHLGERATVCGTVYGGYYARHSRGKPTFLNLDGNYPHQKFTLVIWGRDRYKFHSPERELKGQRVCADGVIGVYRGVPQIVLKSPSQLH